SPNMHRAPASAGTATGRLSEMSWESHCSRPRACASAGGRAPSGSAPPSPPLPAPPICCAGRRGPNGSIASPRWRRCATRSPFEPSASRRRNP
ncbi:MAG: hypothetical protein AVDCRST_MAG91-2196, partial [uncultured Sphingomonadaceae bacterium]